MTFYQDSAVTIYHADCRDILPQLSGIDAVITDPPYELGFMGKDWDKKGISFQPEVWKLILDACKPGAHLLAFGGTRTFHRLAMAIEDAGWEIRDTVMFVYGQGFPKSLDVSKAIDKMAGVYMRGEISPNSRDSGKSPSGCYGIGVQSKTLPNPQSPEAKQWEGWGTGLKPSYEPVMLCYKPLTPEQYFGMIIETITRGLLCQSSNANDVESLFSGIQAKLEEVQVHTVAESARINPWGNIGNVKFADSNFTSKMPDSDEQTKTKGSSVLSSVKPNGKKDEMQEKTTQPGMGEDILSRLMVITMSVMKEDISENTALLWKNISEDLLAHGNTFTIEMATKLTIALRTLNSLMYPLTSNDIGNLSPNFEPIILARKPLEGTVAQNVLKYGTGAINIDGCRIGTEVETWPKSRSWGGFMAAQKGTKTPTELTGEMPQGRFPANLIHDGSEEVLAEFAKAGERRISGAAKLRGGNYKKEGTLGGMFGVSGGNPADWPNDTGTAARFFYTAKASRAERGKDNKHPTVKPLTLMRYLIKLITPPNGVILDPFMGSGSTLVAARQLGFKAIGIDTELNYCEITKKRCEVGMVLEIC